MRLTTSCGLDSAEHNIPPVVRLINMISLRPEEIQKLSQTLPTVALKPVPGGANNEAGCQYLQKMLEHRKEVRLSSCLDHTRQRVAHEWRLPSAQCGVVRFGQKYGMILVPNTNVLAGIVFHKVSLPDNWLNPKATASAANAVSAGFVQAQQQAQAQALQQKQQQQQQQQQQQARVRQQQQQQPSVSATPSAASGITPFFPNATPMSNAAPLPNPSAPQGGGANPLAGLGMSLEELQRCVRIVSGPARSFNLTVSSSSRTVLLVQRTLRPCLSAT